MLETFVMPAGPKSVVYATLARHAEALVEGVNDKIANAANLSAMLYHMLPDISLSGFYFLKHKRLIVGPFQGKPACVTVAVGQGVCGQAATMRKSLIVGDVACFPCHIYCVHAARSYIVITLMMGEQQLDDYVLVAPYSEIYN